ncbi:hypothetical protein Tco_1149438 [Tanacetum coccineum]
MSSFFVKFYHRLELKRDAAEDELIRAFKIDIPKRSKKGKGKRPPLSSSPSSPTSIEDVEPYLLSFYNDLPKGPDVSYEQKEKRAMFKCLTQYLSKLAKKFK